MDLEEAPLGFEEIVYVADMLRAVAWSKSRLSNVSDSTLNDLGEALSISEAALRRVAAEMRVAQAE